MTRNRRSDKNNGVNVFLYFAAVIVHITSVIVGIIFTWSTPVTPKLENVVDNPLGFQLSVDQSSWVASLASLGAVVGPFLGGYLGDKIGRKQSCISTTIVTGASFALLAFAKNLYLFYVLRFIAGICMGVLLTIIPIYVVEIAEIHNRGKLGGFYGVFLAVGQIFCFAVGPYTSIQTFSLLCIIFPAIFVVICILFIPESPCYLIMKGKHEEAEEALKKLRRNCNVDDELVALTATVKESLANSGGISDIFRTKYLRNGLMISAGLMIIQQIAAISVILFYMQGIFESSGSSMPKEIGTLIVGIVQFIATLVSSSIVDKLGRRPLLLISTSVSCLSLLTLSLYFYLKITIDVSSIAWLPLVTLMVYIFFYNLGIGPMPVTILEPFGAHRSRRQNACYSVKSNKHFSFEEYPDMAERPRPKKTAAVEESQKGYENS
ncbi:hypothetical protein Trydic_g11109 [Trypoxylus dichotomus]